jgi:nitrogen fixation protein FixH
MDGVEVDNKTTLVADNIYAADFSPQDGIWKLSVETRSGDRSVTREYEIGYRLAQ